MNSRDQSYKESLIVCIRVSKNSDMQRARGLGTKALYCVPKRKSLAMFQVNRLT